MTRSPYGTGSIVPRGDRKFTIRWSEGRDPFTGKHMRRTLTLHDTTITEARRVLAAKTATRRTTTRMTLGDLIDHALPELDITDNTRDRYRIALRHIPDGARAWKLADITIIDAGQLVEGLNARTGAATVRKAVAAIQSCWKHGYRQGLVPRDSPFAGLKLPEVNRSAGKILADDHVKALIAVADRGEEEAWLLVSLATGARPGEVRQLRWSQVDLERAVVTFIDTKHDGAERRVAIGQAAVDALEDWRAMQREHRNLVDDPHLFSTRLDASTPWSKNYAGRDRWHRLRERAGVPEGYRLNDLRHTSNSVLASEGVADATRGKRAGNSAAVNDAVYTHLHPADDRHAAEITDRWITERR